MSITMFGCAIETDILFNKISIRAARSQGDVLDADAKLHDENRRRANAPKYRNDGAQYARIMMSLEERSAGLKVQPR
jgi:hypothetical protein